MRLVQHQRVFPGCPYKFRVSDREACNLNYDLRHPTSGYVYEFGDMHSYTRDEAFCMVGSQ